MSISYIFQGNPKYYDMDAYLASHPYIYWRCPILINEIKVGDKVFMWRAGENAGMVAVGEISEAPCPAEDIKFPEYLGIQHWTSDVADKDESKVGIRILEVRLSEEDGLISRELLKKHPLVKKHRIITNPTGTVFRLEEDLTAALDFAWNNAVVEGDYDKEYGTPIRFESEGKYKIVSHLRRERSSALRNTKIKSFAKEHKRIHCELCKTNLSDVYPPNLAEGYIEVHHIKPIALLEENSPTYLDDLILLCPNCHRMVHRTKNAEKNLEDLLSWFETKR
jgi:hypothetical protein